ncbi:hypothetical protein AB4Y87_25320 [Paenarthrobacter sp. RAF54_2]|uniref:hypothetical protein n=1 Tax=Paenarthrobacter sp. RAF54_2 TaxID=3233061 RepID=UPI003F9DF11B
MKTLIASMDGKDWLKPAGDRPAADYAIPDFGRLDLEILCRYWDPGRLVAHRPTALPCKDHWVQGTVEAAGTGR